MATTSKKIADRIARQRALRSLTYYTVTVPYASTGATAWHPTERTGAFSVLSRGAFKTRAQAKAWARKHLAGKQHTVKMVRP